MPSPFGRAYEYLNGLLLEPAGERMHLRQIRALALAWVVCTMALLLLRPNRDYLFPPLGFTDSWLYTGFQWDLRGQFAEFGLNYFASRLTWILPGALMYGLLPPVAANICLKLLVSGLFATACATIVFRAAGFRAALLAVTISVLTPPFVVALHQNYVAVAVIVYGALALACITVARDARRWPLWIFSGGVFLTCMAVANLGSVGPLGLGCALFHLLWLRWSFKRQLVCLAVYLVAVATVLTALGGIYVRLGGEFNVLRPQIEMVLHFHGMKVNPYAAPNLLWLFRATWLILPVGTLLWGLVASCRAPAAGRDSQLLIRALTGALFVALAWAAWSEFRDIVVLSTYFYASYHLTFALPLLALLGWSAPWSFRKPAIWAGLFLIVLLVVVVIGHPMYYWQCLVPLHRWVPTAEFLPLLAAGLVLLLGLLGAVRGLPSWMRQREIVVLGLLLCSMPAGFSGAELTDHLRERYGRIHAAYQVIMQNFARRTYLFWLHPDEPGGTALSYTRFNPLLTSTPFPGIGPDLRTDRPVVIIVSPPGRGRETLAIATTVLGELHFDLVHPRIMPAPVGHQPGFELVCFSLHRRPTLPDSTAPGAPAEAVLLDLRYPYVGRLEQNLYGADRSEALDASAGYSRFKRTDPRDHLATAFSPFSTLTKNAARQVSVTIEMPEDGATSCVFQTDGFVDIARIVLTKKGPTTTRVVVPAGHTSFRIYFQGDTDRPTSLPTRVTIREMNP